LSLIKNLLLSLIIIVFAFVLTTLVDENSISYGSLSLFLLCTIIIFFLQWIVFIPSYFLSTEHFFDLTGSVTFITVSILAFLMNDSKNLRQFIVLVLIMIWALRLGSFLFLRIRKAGEDSRFTIIKKDFLVFFLTWNLQGLWVLFTLFGALTILTSNNNQNFGILDIIGILIWIIGFVIEVVSDRQKSEFKSHESNDGKFIQSGLWKYSRHPNYFGEILIWTGIAIIGISVYSGFGWLGLISPFFVFVMLNYISGVRLLEKQAEERWGGNDLYQSYKSKTPVLFPYKFIKD
jgi:steroid 5-alpha reductase family enzyme|tara:strand:- start:839 stop:1711 length:873 start_codon:yes stop_codon:yes gene_type:complete